MVPRRPRRAARGHRGAPRPGDAPRRARLERDPARARRRPRLHAGQRSFTVDAGAAVSPAFASGAVRPLVEACDARGIVATVGARYPACHRENLLQLFTSRYVADPRPAVRRLADLASSVDAVQLELGIPLRWPGAWRERSSRLHCCGAGPGTTPPLSPASSPIPMRHRRRRPLEFTTPTPAGAYMRPALGPPPVPPDGHLCVHQAAGSAAPAALRRPGRALGISSGSPAQFPDPTPSGYGDRLAGAPGRRRDRTRLALELPLPPHVWRFGRVRPRSVSTRLRGARRHGFDGPRAAARLCRAAARCASAPDAGSRSGRGRAATRRHVFRAGRARRSSRPRDLAPAPRLSTRSRWWSRSDGARRAAPRRRASLPVVWGAGPPVLFEFAACRVTDVTSPGSRAVAGATRRDIPMLTLCGVVQRAERATPLPEHLKHL